MDLQLRDQVAIVTGGASNIGRGIVHALAAEGARVLVADHDGDQADRVVTEARQLGAADVATVIGDLTVGGAGQAVVDAAVERWGSVDVLVNNVGWNVPAFFAQTDETYWRRTIDLNLLTTFACTHAVLAPMRDAARGSIVFISSDAAMGEPRNAVYGATKAGIIALARSIAREHGRDGIRANVVCPGLVLPDDDAVGDGSLWHAGREALFDDDQLASITRSIPLRRLTTADDVAASVLWFASEVTGRQLTGQVVSVSGGFATP